MKNAAQFTNPNMVALLASLTPMCLVVWRGVTGESVHVLEILGVLLALAGGVISTVGEGADDGEDVIYRVLYFRRRFRVGDLVCLRKWKRGPWVESTFR